MPFISLLGLGLGVLATVALGTAMFVSVAFGLETCDRIATETDGVDFEVTDSCVLQVLRDSHGEPLVATGRRFHARPSRSTRP